MDRHGAGGEEAEATAPARAGFLATLRAVLWSFAGVRRRHDHQRDFQSLDPRAVIVAGVLAALVFVLVLVALAHLAVSPL